MLEVEVRELFINGGYIPYLCEESFLCDTKYVDSTDSIEPEVTDRK